MNLKEIFGTAKPKAVVKKDYGLIASICQELDIRKPHREYDEWDMYIGKDDQVCYCTKEDLVIEDLSNQIWLPIQLNGQTARLQIDDLICTALKTQDPNKVREIPAVAGGGHRGAGLSLRVRHRAAL